MEWNVFRVGMRRAEWLNLADGLRMEWADQCGFTLFAFYNKPSVEEVANFSSDKHFEITFKDVGGIGFFSLKFGDLPWGDCAFSPNFYDPLPDFPRVGGHIGYSLNIMLIDTSVGELKSMRTIGLGGEFSQNFHEWAVASIEKNISQTYYNKVVTDAFARYPDSSVLAAEGDFRWILHHRDDRPERSREERVEFLE